MLSILIALASLGSVGSALPAPTPIITPAPDLSRRQDESSTKSRWGCSITYNEASEFEHSYLLEASGTNFVYTTDIVSLPAGNVCYCNDGDVIAGISTSTGNDGRETEYCAAGEASDRVPQATTTPESSPGDPENEGWAEVQCDEGSLDDIFNNPWEQWNDSGAAGAWSSAKDAWDNADDDRKESLSNFLGNYFHAKPATSCEILDNSNCEGTITCGQNFEGNSPVTSPAGYVILNSLFGVHTLFEDVYAGVNDAIGTVNGRIGTFVDTYSPIGDDIEDQKRTKLIMDGIQAAMFLILPPTFHSGISRTNWAKQNPNLVSAGFDWTYNMIGTTMATVKDAMEQLSPLPVQNELSEMAIDTAKGWLSVINETNHDILNSPDNAFALIDQGMFFPPDEQKDPLGSSEAIEKAIFASLLPAAWISADPEKHGPPVIVTADGISGGSRCDSYDPEDFKYSGDRSGDSAGVSFNDGALDAARGCVGDTPYWLMSVRVKIGSGCNPYSGDPTSGTCVETETPLGIQFDALKGIDSLDDFDLSTDEIIGNAVNSWEANDKKNGWDTMSMLPTDAADVADLIEKKLGETRGIVKIPVCSISELVDYMNKEPEGDSENANYPCPP